MSKPNYSRFRGKEAIEVALRYQDWEWQLNLPCPRCGGKPAHLSSHCHGQYIEIEINGEKQTIFAHGGWRSGVYCSKCGIIYCHECRDNPQLVGRKSWKVEDDSGIG